jgi:hypothetical protein
MQEVYDPVQSAAYSNDSFEKLLVSQHLTTAGNGPRTKKPGGGLPETLGELCIELSRRLCSIPKLFVRNPNPAVLPLPSERCDRDRSDNG